jgi:FK506-binding protein 2
MRLSWLTLPVLVLSVLGQDLQINITSSIECERKSHKGDVISVNYRGTFTNGTEFDSSVSSHVSRRTC